MPLVAQDVSVLDWKRDHPILRTLNVSESLRRRSDASRRARRCRAAHRRHHNTATRALSTIPATHLVYAFDLLQSNWPMRETFPYFLYNTMQFRRSAARWTSARVTRPARCRIPRTNLIRADADAKDVRLIGPGGNQTVRVPDGGDSLCCRR